MALAGCSEVQMLANGTAGRETCWPENADLTPVIIEATLDVTVDGPMLALSNGRRVEVGFAAYGTTVSADGSGYVEDESGRTVAEDGDRIVLFGGWATPALFHACTIDARARP
jgi:hypothetical protein